MLLNRVDLSVNGAASIFGNYGMQVVINDTDAKFVTDELPNAEKRYRARFYFDPNSMIGSGSIEPQTIFSGSKSNPILVEEVAIKLRRTASIGSFQIQAGIRLDNSTWAYTSWFTINNAPHANEIDWKASTSGGANNGSLTLWMDGTQQAQLSSIDNDSHWIDEVKQGVVVNGVSGIRATYCFDAFEARRNTYIGVAPGRMRACGSTQGSMSAENEGEGPTSDTGSTSSGMIESAITISSTTTITYTYDPLYRLTAADYEDGTFYHYTYDPVGNRLSQETIAGWTSYTYDIANRLTNVNGVDYTWDHNGNLLNDGVYTYTYNHANRLAEVSGAGVTASFAYNGIGDRLEQTVNGENTRFTMDLNAGLTQVLSDGTSTYLYGLRRIAQSHPAGTEYFLGDAISSVRQITDSTGTVVLANNYYPYGELRSSQGDAVSDYGFTGEWTDGSIVLIYLRARWYAPSIMRFIQPDPDVPESQGSTLGFDRYAFVANNPLKYVDPSGHCWGVASAIRGIPGYGTTCNNLDMALSIVQHPEASISQKAGAGAYIAAEGLAHGALTLGTAALACSAVAPCATAVEAALGIGTGVWSLNVFDRGWAIENMIGRGSLLRNLSGFPTIDRFEKGIATSIKSIDLGAKTYQDIGALTYQVQGYIDKLAGFTGARYGGVNITNAMIRGRELILAIPRNASAEQLKALQKLAADAVNQGVNLVLKVIK